MNISLSRLQLLNIVVFSVAILFNALSSLPSKPFAGQTNADISNAYRTAFTPAGYAFSIWGLIYSLGSGFVIFQALPSSKEWTAKLGYVFALSCVGNGSWIIVFANELGQMWVSVGVIFGLILTPLIVFYMRLNPGVKEIAPFTLLKGYLFKTTTTTALSSASESPSSSTSTSSSTASSWAELIFAQTFASIYLGWCVVACVANFSIALTPRNAVPVSFASLSPSEWSIIMQITATIIAVLGLCTRLDAAFAGPIAWALIAIARQQASPDWPGNGTVVSTAKILGYLLVTAIVIVTLVRVWAFKSGLTVFKGNGGSTTTSTTSTSSTILSGEQGKISMKTTLITQEGGYGQVVE